MPKIVKNRIIVFLKSNKNTVYTVNAVASVLKVSPITVRKHLNNNEEISRIRIISGPKLKNIYGYVYVG